MANQNLIPIDDILDAFRVFDGTYQRKMVDAAIARRAEIIPRLTGILEEIIANPEGFLEKEDRFDHLYAFMLLGHFKAVASHGAVVQVFSLKPKLVDELFPDYSKEWLPVVLLRTCGGDLRAMRIMALDRSVDTYCRLGAVQAMVYAVATGIAVREQVMAFIAGLFTDAQEEADPTFLSFAAIALLNLYPEEQMALIKRAFHEEIIDPAIIRLESSEQVLAQGKENTLAEIRKELRRFDLAEIHDRMSRWSCFEDDESWTAASGPQDLIESGFYGRPQRKTPEKTKPLKKNN